MISQTQNLTDGDLLKEFLTMERQEAFAEIISRHGAMVYGICLRILGRSQDAEDAVQATFHTLALKATQLRAHPSIAGWLHHVAWNISMNAKRALNTRRTRESEAATEMDLETSTPASREWEDLKPLLDQALDSLPEKYRVPILLHHIEGRTQEEVSRLLNCNLSTVSMRLTRGRQKLKDGLKKRGVLLGISTLLALMTNHASAAMPETLATHTLHTTKLALLHQAAGGAISAKISALTQEAMKMLFMEKLKMAGMLAASIVMMSSAAGIITHSLQETPDHPSLHPGSPYHSTNAPSPYHPPYH